MKKLHKKMKLLSFFMAAGLVLSSMMLQVEAYIQKAGTVNEAVSLRQNAEASSSQLMELSSGQEVKVNNELTDVNGTIWYQVLIGTTVGYVPANTITISENAAPEQGSSDGQTTGNDTASGMQTVTKTRRVGQVLAGNAVRVRPDASTNNAQIASLSSNEKFEVIEDVNGSDGYVWYHITFVQEGVEINGYVRSDLVNVTEETYEEQVPSQQEPTVPSETEQQSPYSVVSQTNAEGTNVWYLKDNTTGEVKDIAALLTPVTEEKSGGTSKLLLVLLLIFFIVALAGAALFYMKWKDAEELIRELREKQARSRKQPSQAAHTAPVSPTVSSARPSQAQKSAVELPSRTAVKNTAARPTASASQQSVRKAPVNHMTDPTVPKTINRPVSHSPERMPEQPAAQKTGQTVAQKVNRPTAPTMSQPMTQKAEQPFERENMPKASDIVKTTKKEIQNKAAAPITSQPKSWKSKNFLTDDDDLEFDFLETDHK